MPKLFSVIIFCSLIVISCSTSAPSASSTTDFNAGNEAELRDGAARVEQLTQELLGRGFRTTSTSTSNLWHEVTLKGDYGALKDVEVTLHVANQLDKAEPHLKAVLHASFPNQPAKQEFEGLDAHIKSAIRGQ